MTTEMMESAVEQHFSGAATTYDAAADVQRRTANRLGTILRGLIPFLPDGPVLEIGCGTGLMTAHILTAVDSRPVHVTDLSSTMLLKCRDKLQAQLDLTDSVTFGCLDAGQLNRKNHFSCIICSFSLQWFGDAESALNRIMDSLVEGGHILLSVPTDRSFPEWKEVCRSTGSTFSGNSLPSRSLPALLAKNRGWAHSFDTEQMQSRHENALAFFRGLRSIGADFRLQPAETNTNLRKVIREWDRRQPSGIVSTYEVCHGWICSANREVT